MLEYTNKTVTYSFDDAVIFLPLTQEIMIHLLETEVFTVVKVEFVVFQVVALYSMVVEYQRFGRLFCLHLQALQP
jgi:hypothetical protein